MTEQVNIYDMVIMGNYTKDTIISPSGTRIVDGGGFNYGAHVAAMMGLKTAAVTRLAKEDKHVVDNLIRLGVDVYACYTSQSVILELYYPTTNVDERILTVNGTAGAFTVDQVEFLEARMFLINASTRGEVPREVIEVLSQKEGLVVADAQGFVRVISPDGKLIYDPWPGKEDILPFFDVLKVDIVEAEILTGESDIKKQAVKLAGYGPREIILTHKNGVLVYAENQFHEAIFQPKELVGRSGRGDTCIASYMGKRLTASPEKSTIWAAAVTSLKMEAEGPILRNESEVEALIREKYVLRS